MMEKKVRNLFGQGVSEGPDDINREMVDRLRDLADRAENGEIAAIFCVYHSPALHVEAEWLGHMGTGLTLRGAIARGASMYSEAE